MDRLLDELWLPPGRWLEPGAGEGAIIAAVNARRCDVDWTAIELRAACAPVLARAMGADVTKTELAEIADVHGSLIIGPFPDRLDPQIDTGFDVAIGNPPFAQAETFIRACRSRAQHVVMLLRVGFLESKDRQPWLSVDAPDVYILPNRPSFAADGATDSSAYMWAHWRWVPQARGTLKVLGLTPKDVRRAGVKRKQKAKETT